MVGRKNAHHPQKKMTAATLNVFHTDPACWLSPYLQRMDKGDYTTLCLFYQPNGFKFDEALAESLAGKKLVVLDMRELGWHLAHDDVAVAGVCSLPPQMGLYPEKEEYDKLDQWVIAQNPIAYFKREFSATLQKRHMPFPVYPIDLLSFTAVPLPPTRREDFLKRKGGIFFNYGNSHPDRLLLHGALQSVRNSASNSLGVAQQVLAKGYETDLLEQVHFSVRYPLAMVLDVQGMFKVSVALGGNGAKTFRHSEACIGAVPVVADIGMKYAVEFNDENAIMLPTVNGRIDPQQACTIIGTSLMDVDKLWQKMLPARDNALRLEPNFYFDTFVNPHIKSAL